MPARDVELFVVRLERWWPDLDEAWRHVYAERPDEGPMQRRLVTLLADRYRERPDALKSLDLVRSARPDWFQDPSMIGYVCYPGLFGGTLSGVGEHLDYLAELHIRYLHLMPLLRTRPGAADGGYAVAD